VTVSTSPVLDALRQPWRTLWERQPLTEPPRLIPLPIGEGQPVLVFPMFGTGAQSTQGLRAALDRAGFHCHDWGYGVDIGPRTGNLRQRLRRLEECVIDVFESEREPVTLLGWGLSGLYARELAKRVAPLVRQVITLGTPFQTGAGRCAMLQPLCDERGELPAALARELRESPPVPCTSIYSMSDRVVPWQMCVQPQSPTAQNIMVAGSDHAQLADRPRVREIIADRLAQPEGDWRPYGH